MDNTKKRQQISLETKYEMCLMRREDYHDFEKGWDVKGSREVLSD